LKGDRLDPALFRNKATEKVIPSFNDFQKLRQRPRYKPKKPVKAKRQLAGCAANADQQIKPSGKGH